MSLEECGNMIFAEQEKAARERLNKAASKRAGYSLPTDSAARKNVPLVDGLDGYFPAALVGVAEHSFRSNAQHNPGQPMHWSINKSTDHANCIRRHLVDLCEFLAAYERDGTVEPSAILAEADALAWRALALSQKLRMRFAGAPLPFNAKE